MTGTSILIGIGCIAVIYFVLCNRFVKFVHPVRMEMVELGGKLLSDSRLPEEDAMLIESALEHNFSSWRAWLFVLILPLAVIAAIIDTVRGSSTPFGKIPVDLRSDVGRFIRLSTVTVLSNSPLAAFLFVLILTTATMLFFPVDKAMRELMRSLAVRSDFYRHHTPAC